MTSKIVYYSTLPCLRIIIPIFNTNKLADEEGSIGYDDVACMKIPGLCKFTQGTWSIDDDSCAEQYNTYDETY